MEMSPLAITPEERAMPLHGATAGKDFDDYAAFHEFAAAHQLLAKQTSIDTPQSAQARAVGRGASGRRFSPTPSQQSSLLDTDEEDGSKVDLSDI